MGIPARPRVQHQGPACHCTFKGVCLGWVSCTCYATAMAVDKATIGAKRPSGCDVRILTNDAVGGTTLPQCAGAVREEYGVKVEVRVGSAFATDEYIAAQLRAGRGVVVQGSTRPTLSTTFRSTGGAVNHAIYVNEGRGWNANGTPDEVLVYDPAADGRRAGWGTADESPSWWPWGLLVRFAGALQPWGEGDSRVLGKGRFYAALFADTEPHVHLKYGAKRTTPFPDHTTAYTVYPKRQVNVRSRPDRLRKADIVDTLRSGEEFVAYQVTNSGVKVAGSTTWYGDHNGSLWIHASGLKGKGGTR